MGALLQIGVGVLLLFGLHVATAQTFPRLTGRVVDGAGLLSPAQEAAIATKLEAVETASSRQLVVATVPDLQGYEIEEYGYRLLRTWGIGQKDANNGAILLVSRGDRKVRIEVGYGLEAILTDAFSNRVVEDRILPAFRADDYPAGIAAGVDAIAEQLRAPPEVAEKRSLDARTATRRARGSNGGGSIFPLLFWLAVLVFIVLPMLRRAGGGRRHRRSGWTSPVILWGPSLGGGGFGSGGFGGGGFGGGGFSGGGGSGGGGGASGSW